MARLLQLGETPVTWNGRAERYFSSEKSPLGQIYDRLTPVPDPIMVTVGPGASYGRSNAWEGTDPATGRRYVARKSKCSESVILQEIVNI